MDINSDDWVCSTYGGCFSKESTSSIFAFRIIAHSGIKKILLTLYLCSL